MLTPRRQILVDDERYDALERAARERRVSVATVVRDAIDRDLAGRGLRRAEPGRRLLEAEPMAIGTVAELLVEIEALRGRLG